MPREIDDHIRRRIPGMLVLLLLAIAIVGEGGMSARPMSPALAGPLGPGGVQAAPNPPPPQLVVEGKGWGHGVGMSQDGALAMGRAGASTGEILGHFYPGTAPGRAAGPVKIVVLPSAGPATLIELPDGGQVRDDPSGPQSPGFPVELGPGGRAELSFDGTNFTVRAVSGLTGQGPSGPSERGTQGPSGPAPTPAPPVPAGPPGLPPGVATSPRALTAHPRQGSTTVVLATGRRYRGVVRTAPAPGGLRLLNDLDVEQYLRGMGEVRDPSWPSAALGAQAIAARTYALQTMSAAGEICDTDRCQVYLGQTAEYAAMDRAVAATAGQVVVYGDALAHTFYSASGGGVSATPEEGFGPGGTNLPYLVAAPYPTENPMAWDMRFDLAAAARRLGYGGQATAVRVSREGPSGRPLEVTVEGDRGPLAVDGRRFMTALGLRSNLFTVRLEGGPPPQPEAVDEAEPPATTGVPAPPAPSVPEERLAATGSDVGSTAVLLTVVVLLVAWIGFRHRRLARPEGIP